MARTEINHFDLDRCLIVASMTCGVTTTLPKSMRKSAFRFSALVATFAIAGSVSAQQAAKAPSEPVTPPNWDVLMRPRTHNPSTTTAAITPADLATRLYIFADDSMQGRLLATAGNVKGVRVHRQ